MEGVASFSAEQKLTLKFEINFYKKIRSKFFDVEIYRKIGRFFRL